MSLGPARPPERELMKTMRGASVMSGSVNPLVPTRKCLAILYGRQAR